MSGRAPVRCALLAAAVLAAAACSEGEAERAIQVPGGDPDRGKVLLRRYGCGGCHVIPGVPGARSTIGPPLTHWVERQYIAGALWNTPENLIDWIVAPQEIEPRTAMPDLEVGREQARHMAAYLYTIGDAQSLGPPHLFPVEILHKLGTGGGKKSETETSGRAPPRPPP